MIQKAIIKINTEMQKSPNDKQLEAIGHHVIDAITTEANAKAVLDEKKTLNGARAEVRSAAKKQAVNGMAMIASDEVFAIVDKYFGISAAPTAPAVPAPGKVSLDIGSFF